MKAAAPFVHMPRHVLFQSLYKSGRFQFTQQSTNNGSVEKRYTVYRAKTVSPIELIVSNQIWHTGIRSIQ